MISIYRRRRIVNQINMTASVLVTVLGIAVLVLILYTLLRLGIPGLGLRTFTDMTPAPGSSGGLLNAIAGSLVLTIAGIAIGAPVGVLAATYLAEYGGSGKFAEATRFIKHDLLSSILILIGLFYFFA